MLAIFYFNFQEIARLRARFCAITSRLGLYLGLVFNIMCQLVCIQMAGEIRTLDRQTQIPN